MDEKYSKSPGFLLAAPKSGSGKTTLACAFMQALKDRGQKVQAFKCGPDYIDPMFHRQVIGVNSKNLDPYFCGPDELCALYADRAAERDIAVLEGAMGLFDGLGGVSEEASAYRVAQAIRVPVVLVVDAHGMGRSVIPMLAGFMRYDTQDLICGVILNRISGGFYGIIAPVIERELFLPVLGYFPDDPTLHIDSRHLGLQLPGEIAGLKEQTERAAGILEQCVQIDRLLDIAGAFCEGEGECPDIMPSQETVYPAEGAEETGTVRIAVARDEAFCFYYEDNLRLLEKLGARLVFFSPLHDKSLPEDIDGLLLGGGYPELYARQLEDNAGMRRGIRQALWDDMPSLAECGGFMYLHDHLVTRESESFEMCGVLPADCRDTGRSVRFGYVSVSEKQPRFLAAGQPIKGHEFHYFDSTLNGDGCTAIKPVSGRSWDCVHVTGRHWWGFPHLYYPSGEGFAKHFIGEAKKFHQEKKAGERCL